MASDETMTFNSSLQDEEDFDDDMYDHHHHHHHHHHDHHHPPNSHNLSRLSVCTSSTLCDLEENEHDDVDNLVSMCVSQLSIESFDADGEFSDGKETPISSDSDTESGSTCYSLPATPPRRRNRGHQTAVTKEYSSDNEARKETKTLRRRRVRKVWENSENSEKKENLGLGFSGESDQSGTGMGVMVITRPKGGKRALCMDLEEVKACRDLGFELEHERMLEVPSRLSVSNSTLETSSGGNSPIDNWRISGPGDDPREVKARLKVWAQAVALASASKYGT